MNSSSFLLTIAAMCMLCTIAFAADCPPCDPEAGCPRVGCPCQQGAVPYRPGRHPEQLLVAGCAECAPVTVCRASLIRLRCNVERECSEEERRTHVVDDFALKLQSGR